MKYKAIRITTETCIIDLSKTPKNVLEEITKKGLIKDYVEELVDLHRYSKDRDEVSHYTKDEQITIDKFNNISVEELQKKIVNTFQFARFYSPGKIICHPISIWETEKDNYILAVFADTRYLHDSIVLSLLELFSKYDNITIDRKFHGKILPA